MAQTGAEGERLTMRIVILKSMHESKEELTVDVHGTTYIAEEDESKGFWFPLLHLHLQDLPSVFDRLSNGSSEVKAISPPSFLPTPCQIRGYLLGKDQYPVFDLFQFFRSKMGEVLLSQDLVR